MTTIYTADNITFTVEADNGDVWVNMNLAASYPQEPDGAVGLGEKEIDALMLRLRAAKRKIARVKKEMEGF